MPNAGAHKRKRLPNTAQQKPTERALRSKGSPAPLPDISAPRPPTRIPITNAALKTSRKNKIPKTSIAKAVVTDPVDTVQEPIVPPVAEEIDKRVLRSQDGGSRSKSDLVHFFPDYEDIVFGPEKEPDFLTVDSVLYVTERKPRTQELPIRSLSSPITSPKSTSNNLVNDKSKPLIQKNAKSFSKSVELPIVDLKPFKKEANKFKDDPLPDDIYFQAHKRGERKEKQLRNIEKEHAMHEKGDLERLLGELRGPDWLKAMGISGITETEKKAYEPKRDYYLRRVKALLDKFSTWRELEKEMKVKREQALAIKFEEGLADGEDDGEEDMGEADSNDEQVEDDEQEENQDHEVERKVEEGNSNGKRGVRTNGVAKPKKKIKGQDPEMKDAEYNGVDESALQLQFEASSAYQPKPRKQKRGQAKTSLQTTQPQSLQPQDSAKPFKSLYKKTYQRNAALGKHRRGRSSTAFGEPVPQVEEHDFELPAQYRSEETIVANSRKRRRIKRESKDG